MGFEQIVIAPQTTFGIGEPSGYQRYDHTTIDWGGRPRSVTSAENTPNLMPLPAVLVADEAGGGFGYEARLGVMNDILEGVILDSFSAALAITTTMSVLQATNQITCAGNAFASVLVGQWIWLQNLHVSKNGFHLVVAKPDNNTLTVATDFTTDTLAVAAANISGSMARRTRAIAPENLFFSIEKQFLSGALYSTDVLYMYGIDQYVQTFSIDAIVEQLLSGKIEFIGQAPQSSTTSRAGAYSEPPASQILSPLTSLQAFYEGTYAAVSTLRRAQISLAWNNNHSPDRDLGSGTAGISSVTLNPPTITATVRYNRKSQNFKTSIVDKFLAQTRTKLAWRYQDALNKHMIITLPNTLITGGADPDVPGNTGTRFSEVVYQAEMDDTVSSPHYQVAAQIDVF